MAKFLALLKYLDRSKITAEAVTEIGAVLGRSIAPDIAAAVAEAFKTRGAAGLLPFVPQLLSATTTQSSPRVKLVYQCKHCQQFGAIITTWDELQASGAVLDQTQGE